MMKLRSPLRLTVCTAAAVAFLLPLTASARAKKSDASGATASPSPAASASATPAAKASASPMASPAAMRPIPYHGKISATDPKAKTFTIAGLLKSRTFKLSDKTTISKTGAPATMKDIVVGEEVAGSYWKQADGSLDAKSVKLGPPTAAEQAKKDAAKARRTEKKAEKAGDKKEAASPAPSATPKQ